MYTYETASSLSINLSIKTPLTKITCIIPFVDTLATILRTHEKKFKSQFKTVTH